MKFNFLAIGKEIAMKLYCVEVMTLGGLYPTTKISQEAYNSYDKAVKFCEGRADNPIKIDDYTWKSEQYKYTIIDLDVL